MKDVALALVRETPPLRRANVLREYLQAHLLRSLQRSGGFRHVAFQGGTALRFLHQLARYSEDLDFALERPDGYEEDRLIHAMVTDLEAAGFAVTVHPQREKTVHAVFFKFPGLLFEAGLSPHREEKVSIKWEVDTRPPAGAGMGTTVVNRHFLMTLWHHDLATLMAGKLHALLRRPYTKGRDLYDLVWYLARPERLQPNFVWLNHALVQTDGPEAVPLTASTWRVVLREKLASLDWKKAVDDVAPFVEDAVSVDALRLDTVQHLLND